MVIQLRHERVYRRNIIHTRNMKEDRLIKLFGLNIWVYPRRRMKISHMRPKTIIKGFVYYSTLPYCNSIYIDFCFFKISIAKRYKLKRDK